MKKNAKNVTRKKTEIFEDDPVDQAGLDLAFVEAFINMLDGLTVDRQTLDEVKTSTIAAMCFESRFKIKNLKKFIESVPVRASDVKAA